MVILVTNTLIRIGNTSSDRLCIGNTSSDRLYNYTSLLLVVIKTLLRRYSLHITTDRDLFIVSHIYIFIFIYCTFRFNFIILSHFISFILVKNCLYLCYSSPFFQFKPSFSFLQRDPIPISVPYRYPYASYQYSLKLFIYHMSFFALDFFATCAPSLFLIFTDHLIIVIFYILIFIDRLIIAIFRTTLIF